MSDEEIIALYFARDEQALAQTDAKYGSYCFALANAILPCREDAEEAVNDSYWKAWQTMPPKRPSVLRMFLAKITRNLAFSRWRNLTAQKRGGGELPLVLEELEECVGTDEGLRILYWTNTQEGFHAMLSTLDETVDSLAIAASVAPGAPLELSNDYLGTDYSIELQQEPDTYIGWESIYPQAVPEGYSIDFVSDRAHGEQTVHYKNAAGDSISYTFYYRLGQWGRVFDGMGIPQEVDINGSTGYLNGNQLIWADEAKGYGYALRASEEVGLISIAKSVGIGPELESSDAPNTAKALEELGDYNITALPAGMAEDSFTGSPLEDGGGWYAYVRRWYYNKETNQELYFTYETYVTDADSLEAVAQIAMGDTPAEMRTVHGCTGAAAIRGNQAKVVWIEGTAEKGISFALSSPDYSIEELLAIAESVQKQ